MRAQGMGQRSHQSPTNAEAQTSHSAFVGTGSVKPLRFYGRSCGSVLSCQGLAPFLSFINKDFFGYGGCWGSFVCVCLDFLSLSSFFSSKPGIWETWRICLCVVGCVSTFSNALSISLQCSSSSQVCFIQNIQSWFYLMGKNVKKYIFFNSIVPQSHKEAV